GDLYRVIGQTPAARQYCDRSLRIAGELMSGDPDNLAIQAIIYQAHMGLGLADIRSNRFDDAKRGLHRAVAMAESIAAARPEDRPARRDLIEAYFHLGRSYSFAKEYDAAEPWSRKMHDLPQHGVDEDPHENQAWDLLASALRKRADLRKFAEASPEARR